MAVLSVKNKTKSRSLLVGNEAFDPSATFLIERQTVGAGGAASITFSSIPSTYKHLQVRISGQVNRATYGTSGLRMRMNSDSTSGNYAAHYLIGDGGTAYAGATTSSQTYIIFTVDSLGTGVSNAFGATVIDLLDYANTTTYTTMRALCGVDINGTIASSPGFVGLQSGLWKSTSAVTSLTLDMGNGTLFNQYSTFAIYGIKG